MMQHALVVSTDVVSAPYFASTGVIAAACVCYCAASRPRDAAAAATTAPSTPIITDVGSNSGASSSCEPGERRLPRSAGAGANASTPTSTPSAEARVITALIAGTKLRVGPGRFQPLVREPGAGGGGSGGSGILAHHGQLCDVLGTGADKAGAEWCEVRVRCHPQPNGRRRDAVAADSCAATAPMLAAGWVPAAAVVSVDLSTYAMPAEWEVHERTIMGYPQYTPNNNNWRCDAMPAQQVRTGTLATPCNTHVHTHAPRASLTAGLLGHGTQLYPLTPLWYAVAALCVPELRRSGTRDRSIRACHRASSTVSDGDGSSVAGATWPRRRNHVHDHAAADGAG
jgi:hypothetical protein